MQKSKRSIVVPAYWLCAVIAVHGQAEGVDAADTLVDRACVRRTSLVIGGVFTGTLIALDRAWYADFERGPLRGFNDGDEWLQMDKAGHVFSAYTLSSWAHGAFRRCAPGERWPLWVGGSAGLLFLSTVEMLDGTSAAWGFSWWDMAANATGTGFYIGQELLWREQRIRLKLSAMPTSFAAQRPDLLGEGLAERFLKDYNGQTIWMSANLRAFHPGWRIPRWLNLAVGYGAEGMITAGPLPGDGRYRQFYLSPDVDLTRLPVRKPWLRSLLAVLNSIKLPAPALEVTGSGRVKGHWLHF
jgi:hypothetical protein